MFCSSFLFQGIYVTINQTEKNLIDWIIKSVLIWCFFFLQFFLLFAVFNTRRKIMRCNGNYFMVVFCMPFKMSLNHCSQFSWLFVLLMLLVLLLLLLTKFSRILFFSSELQLMLLLFSILLLLVKLLKLQLWAFRSAQVIMAVRSLERFTDNWKTQVKHWIFK